MKKILLFGMLFGALALVSCRKNHTCECKNNDGTSEVVVLENQRKKVARIVCEANSSANVTCKLK